MSSIAELHESPMPATFANNTIDHGGFNCSAHGASIESQQASAEPMHAAAMLGERVHTATAAPTLAP